MIRRIGMFSTYDTYDNNILNKLEGTPAKAGVARTPIRNPLSVVGQTSYIFVSKIHCRLASLVSDLNIQKPSYFANNELELDHELDLVYCVLGTWMGMSQGWYEYHTSCWDDCGLDVCPDISVGLCRMLEVQERGDWQRLQRLCPGAAKDVSFHVFGNHQRREFSSIGLILLDIK